MASLVRVDYDQKRAAMKDGTTADEAQDAIVRAAKAMHDAVGRAWRDGYEAGKASMQPAPEPEYDDIPEGHQAGPSE